MTLCRKYHPTKLSGYVFLPKKAYEWNAVINRTKKSETESLRPLNVYILIYKFIYIFCLIPFVMISDPFSWKQLCRIRQRNILLLFYFSIPFLFYFYSSYWFSPHNTTCDHFFQQFAFVLLFYLNKVIASTLELTFSTTNTSKWHNWYWRWVR